MNDHNLDDLIIDTPNQKSSKTKGLLTILALFIVVLIVAIILTKIILKDPESHQTIFEENETAMVSPELTLQNAVDDEEQDDDALSEMIKSEMEASKESAAAHKEIEKVTRDTVSIKEESTSVTSSGSQASASDSMELPAQKEIVDTPEDTTEKTAPATKPAPKKVVNEEYFIQVGSFYRLPTSDSKPISLLKKQKFHYRIIKINNMHKVVVGPYENRSEADKMITRVRRLIDKNAFVIKK